MKAEVALLFVAIFWGLTFPLIRNAVVEISPFHFVFLRFFIASILMIPWVVLNPAVRKSILSCFPWGFLLGFLCWISYLSQTIGLQSVPSARAAFITGLNVILVPILAPLFFRESSRARDYLAALVALSGLYLMTDPVGGGVKVGDFWILLCAMVYSIYILLLQKAQKKHNLNSEALTFVQVLGVTFFSLFTFPLGSGEILSMGRNVWIGIGFCSLFATVGSFWLQTKFQPQTTPQKAAVIFSSEPVFAALFGLMILGETLDGRAMGGAGLILGAIVANEWLATKKNK